MRVVATAAALDALTASHPTVLRFATDEAFIPGVRPDQVHVADEHAIVFADAGWSATCCSWAEFDSGLAPFIEWSLPAQRPVLAQGLVAAVPAKLWCTDEGVALIVPSAHVDDLEARVLA